MASQFTKHAYPICLHCFYMLHKVNTSFTTNTFRHLHFGYAFTRSFGNLLHNSMVHRTPAANLANGYWTKKKKHFKGASAHRRKTNVMLMQSFLYTSCQTRTKPSVQLINSPMNEQWTGIWLVQQSHSIALSRCDARAFGYSGCALCAECIGAQAIHIMIYDIDHFVWSVWLRHFDPPKPRHY